METPLFVVAKHPFGVASLVWGTEFVAEGLVCVERYREPCQLQLKRWHLSYGDLPK